MTSILQYLDFLLYINRHISHLFELHGTWIYLILTVIVFCETGLVVTPFLPGDSLLFTVGTLAGTGLINPWLTFILLLLAAICGDNLNYWLGRRIGPAVFVRETSRLLNMRHLFRAKVFCEHNGGKAIVIARFMPIFRTFAPFIAGIGQMNYSSFLSYSLVGGILWTGGLITIGYFFGNISVVRENFSLVIVTIIIASLVPAMLEIFKGRLRSKKINSTK